MNASEKQSYQDGIDALDSLEEINILFDMLKIRRDEIARDAASNLRIGSAVEVLDRRGNAEAYGTVLKLNGKRAEIDVVRTKLGSRMHNGRYTVPYSMLRATTAPVAKMVTTVKAGKLTKADHEEFLRLACALSPENLTCDGELPRSQVQRRLAQLKREWAALESKVGRKVTETEVWQQAR